MILARSSTRLNSCGTSTTSRNMFKLVALYLASLLSLAPGGAFVAASSSAQVASDGSGIVRDVSELQLDANGHLASHWVLYTDGCASSIRTVTHRNHLVLRKAAVMSDELATSIVGKTSPCIAVALERGTAEEHLKNVMPHMQFSGLTGISEWLSDIRKSEIGFMHFFDHSVSIYYVDGSRHVKLTSIESGERNMFWSQSYLGHKFAVRDDVSDELLAEIDNEYNSFHVLGTPPTNGVRPMPREKEEVKRTFDREFHGASEVKRTFTRLGFNKGKLPRDLYASMFAYYYNNRDHLAIEEWYARGGLHVNWYEVPAYMIQMPWELKRTWQTRLRELVQNWIGGVSLENTDIYGMRSYEDGARLISHVDRVNTHAASLIINVAQHGIREPWYIEIYDHAGRLHEIEMNPGDIVYYESAKCLHGRMKPLNGSFYVNIFSHYRPTGDPNWHQKSNPPGTPEPLLDLGSCSLDRSHCANTADPEPLCRPKVKCTNSDVSTLSPSMETALSSSDLYYYWLKYGHKEPPAVRTQVPVDYVHHDAHSEL